MRTKDPKNRFSRLSLWVGVAGVGVGIVAGLLAGIQPLLLGLAFVAVGAVVYFFASFEQAVIGLLVLRSCLDVFSAQQVPAAFALGLDALTLLYVVVQLLTGKTVRTDGFWWFFASWVMLQGLWVILLPLGGLGLDASVLSDSIREWVRLFSWLMVYLLVMQLKDRLPPEKVIQGLFLALILPLTVGFLQMFVPSLLPPLLSPGGGSAGGGLEEGARIRGTLGHSNTFTTLLFLFIGLTCWKLGQSRERWLWLLLLCILAFFYVSTKSLFGLMMLGTFVLVLVAPKLSIPNLIGGVLFFGLVIGLFASSEFGQARLGSLGQTPLLNRDMDISRAILLSQGDGNSFNWRLSQWYLLLKAWQHYPIFGYGLGLSIEAGGNGYLPHNDYVRALVEGGIVGMATFLAFLGAQAVRLIWLLRYRVHNNAQREFCLILLAIFAAIPVGMITENIWSHTTLFFYWWALFGVAGWDWNELQTSENSIPNDPLSKS